MTTIIKKYKQHREEVFNKFFNKQGEAKDFLHCHLGLITEISEVLDAVKAYVAYGREIDLVNIKEEFGDILFFFHYFIEDYEQLFKGVIPEERTGNINKYLEEYITPSLVRHLGSISFIGMFREITVRRDFICFMVETCDDLFEGGFEEVLESNKRKLFKRYGGVGFKKEKANKRDLEGEYESLKTK